MGFPPYNHYRGLPWTFHTNSLPTNLFPRPLSFLHFGQTPVASPSTVREIVQLLATCSCYRGLLGRFTETPYRFHGQCLLALVWTNSFPLYSKGNQIVSVPLIGGVKPVVGWCSGGDTHPATRTRVGLRKFFSTIVPFENQLLS